MMNVKLVLTIPTVMIAFATILAILIPLYPNIDLSHLQKTGIIKQIPAVMLAIAGALVFLFQLYKLIQKIKPTRLPKFCAEGSFDNISSAHYQHRYNNHSRHRTSDRINPALKAGWWPFPSCSEICQACSIHDWGACWYCLIYCRDIHLTSLMNFSFLGFFI